MAFMIGTECINCGACAFECPVRAIEPGPSQFVIDAAVCVECDGYFPVQRCKAACPVGACQPAREPVLAKMRSMHSRLAVMN